jgi:hypothetical protein
VTSYFSIAQLRGVGGAEAQHRFQEREHEGVAGGSVVPTLFGALLIVIMACMMYSMRKRLRARRRSAASQRRGQTEYGDSGAV